MHNETVRCDDALRPGGGSEGMAILYEPKFSGTAFLHFSFIYSAAAFLYIEGRRLMSV